LSKLCNFRDPASIIVQNGNVEQQFQVIVVIVPDIGTRTLWFGNFITLLPNPKRMRFDAGESFHVFD
jgi:hypothetical protein